MNDPFEFLFRDATNYSDENIKRILERKVGFASHDAIAKYKASMEDEFISKDLLIVEGKRQVGRNFAVVCFSSTACTSEEEILLWSHYSNSHKGIRLHFDKCLLDPTYRKLKKIKYSKNRHPVKLDIDENAAEYYEQFRDLIVTKSEVWAYEKEYRLVLMKGECISNSTQMLFYQFPNASLLRVDLGLDCSIEIEAKVVQFLKKKELKHVELFKAKLNKDLFKLEYSRMQ